jgi:hypothetical protein
MRLSTVAEIEVFFFFSLYINRWISSNIRLQMLNTGRVPFMGCNLTVGRTTEASLPESNVNRAPKQVKTTNIKFL